MKRIFLFSLLVLGLSPLFAQETYTFSNLDRDFFEGKELYLQKKYDVSIHYFQRFIENRKELANEDMVQEAEYYVCCESYELNRDIAEESLKTYLEEYPYTQFEDRCYWMLGNISFRSRQYNKALTYYQKANRKRLGMAESDEILFNEGYSYVVTKKYDQAKGQFNELLSKDSRYEASANYYTAYCDYAQKNYDAALDRFLKIEKDPSYSAFVPYYIVQIYYQHGDYEKLQPYALEVLERNPKSENNSEVYRILGECAYRKKNYDKAIDYMTSYEKMTPKVQRGDMYLLGMAYYETGNYKDAIVRLAKVTTEKDSLAQNAYLHLGNCYLKQDKKTNARMAFRSASEMKFDAAVKEESAYNYALCTLETTTPFGESVKAFDAFLQDYPDSKYKDSVNERLVNVYMTTHNYEAASESLAKLKNLSPEMKDAKAYILFQLGTEDYLAGDYEKAKTDFSKSLWAGSENFKNAQVYYWRGETNYRLGKYSEARSDYQVFFTKKGASEFEGNIMVNYNLAYTYFKQKNYGEAIPYFEKYLKAEQSTNVGIYSDALDRLGDCYFAGRDLANAEKYYGQSAKIAGKTGDYATFQNAIVKGLRKNYKGKVDGMQRVIDSYPNSQYEDDAYYEMARAYVLMDQQEKAINTYRALMGKFPQSVLSRKAALEIGMLYRNEGNNEAAIEAYKMVIATYPHSDETSTALESMQNIYVEKNQVADYFTYTHSLDSTIVTTNPSEEDSLTYLAAERLYMNTQTEAATSAFANYIEKFCKDGANGSSCVSAKYYLSDCYQTAGRMNEAAALLTELSTMEGNPYMEQVLVRLAQITYDQKDYQKAQEAFQKLLLVAQEQDNISAAKIGVLRCSYLLNDSHSTISMASNILSDKKVSDDLSREAHFYQAKAYIQLGENEKAQKDLVVLAKDLRTESGAESKYLVANYYFENGNDKKAESEIMDYISQGTPYQYWLARAFVLLSDIYIKRGDDFQAKQYLLSLKANYKEDDSIQDLIQERLDAIAQRDGDKILE